MPFPSLTHAGGFELAARMGLVVLLCSACESPSRDGDDAGRAPRPRTDAGTTTGDDAGPGVIPSADAGPGGGDAGEILDPDAGPPPAGSVPMFIASGRGGRRLVSCDLGASWLEPCTTDGVTGPCRVNTDNADHAAWASTGLTYGHGTFMALYGWFGSGASAQILRTRDGRSWENVFGGAGQPTGTFGTGIAFGDGVFLVNAQRSGTHLSADDGESWSSTTFRDGDAPHRRSLLFIPYGGGRFVSYGDDDRLTYSDDGGATWTDTTSNCGATTATLAWGAGVLVAKNHDTVCRSTDGGLTFDVQGGQGFGGGGIVYTGSEFFISRAYTGSAFVSTDGTAFHEVSITGFGGGDLWPSVLGYGAGVMVGTGGGSHYFRSEDDGRTWTEVSGPSGTTITHITFGYGAPSVDCPAP